MKLVVRNYNENQLTNDVKTIFKIGIKNIKIKILQRNNKCEENKYSQSTKLLGVKSL